jgi:YD repeat-containing protein
MKSFRLLLIIATVFIVSCRKSEISNGSGKITKIIAHLADSDDSTRIYQFEYDDQDRLIRISDTRTGMYGFTTTVSVIYSADDRLLKMVGDHLATDTFVYDNLGRISKQVFANQSRPSDVFTYSYAYDLYNRLISDTTNVNGDDNSTYFQYDYDGNGDISRTRYYWIDKTRIIYTTNFDATFDTTNNPYSKLGLPFYLYQQDATFLSKHAISTRSFGPGRTVQYHYEYFDDGLVKRVIMTDFPDIGMTTDVDFYYD